MSQASRGTTPAVKTIGTNNAIEDNKALVALDKALMSTNPHFACARLPPHWRSNKALPEVFRVLALKEIPDGTEVRVIAINEMGQESEVRNDTATFQNNVARFNDLRFVGKSGRGETQMLHHPPFCWLLRAGGDSTSVKPSPLVV